jgi:Fic family protein
MIFSTPDLDVQELRALEVIDKVRNEIKYALRTPTRWLGSLRRSSFARAIRGSNSIEGYNVTAEDAIEAAEGEALPDASLETWNAMAGYRIAMTYVLQLSNDPHFCYSEGLLKSLHFMMLQHELKKHPGTYRPGVIYVRDDQTNKIVYEGPVAESVPELTHEFVEALNTATTVPALIRASMAHLNLVMIHPFSDGNGRMGRSLQTLVLGREGILEPEFSSIEEYLGRNTPDYYDVLAAVGRGQWHPDYDARKWVRFCLTAHYRQARTIARRIDHTSLVWDELETELKKRKLPERCIFALADATMGFRIRNGTYRKIADISQNLASRDLNNLVEQKLLVAEGAARGRAYRGSELLREIRRRNAPPKKIEDPFEPNSSPSLFPEYA